MRVLFLAGPRPDFLQDVVYHGLVSSLGADAVVEYPDNPRYHGAPPEDPRFSMLSFDVPRPPARPLEELVQQADAIVLGSVRAPIVDAVRRTLALRGSTPTVYLDGEDDPYVYGIVRHVDAYFKREVLTRALRLRAEMPLRRVHHSRVQPERWRDPLRRQVRVATRWTRRVTPLPFGIVDTGFAPSGPRDVDVAFLANPTSPERAAVAAALAELRRDGYVVQASVDLPRPLSWPEFMEQLARCRVAVSVRGLGFDTYRYWEIPYAGAVLLAETPRIVVPDNFVDGVEAVFAPLGGIAARARELLARPGLEAIAERGRRKLLERHTSVQRAAVVLERIESLRRGRRS